MSANTPHEDVPTKSQTPPVPQVVNLHLPPTLWLADLCAPKCGAEIRYQKNRQGSVGKEETTNWSYSTAFWKYRRFPEASMVSYRVIENTKVKTSATRGSKMSGA